MIHEVSMGRRKRMSFSKIREVIDMPDLIEVQKKSYNHFFEVDLREVLNDISPIVDFSNKLVLEFIDYYLDENKKYDVDECKERDATYSTALKVKVRLTNRETGEVTESDVFMGDFPLMTEQGTFVINGAERVIVSQLVRSPGAYFGSTRDKSGKMLFSGTSIPNRGAWLEYETDSNGCVYVRVDRTRKVPVTVFLRALGYGSDEELYEIFGHNENLEATIAKDSTKNTDEGLIELYKRLRPGEPPTVESSSALLNGYFFDAKRYDFARVGRYKFNKKLGLGDRIVGKVLAKPLINPYSGEVVLDAGETVSREVAATLVDLGVNEAYIQSDDDRAVKVFGNGFCNARILLDPLGINPDELGINEYVHMGTLKAIIDEYEGKPKEELIDGIKLSINDIIPKHIVKDDILAVVNYIFALSDDIGCTDDIDHLGNRRLRSVGELLQNQIR
ncbi:MAG: DNA-directed RNA polymerase subunit beta, partial [Clostridia bacterium]|nr:DNA-directed RNA polymerase subunit beta [Clostridia bacterium]